MRAQSYLAYMIQALTCFIDGSESQTKILTLYAGPNTNKNLDILPSKLWSCHVTRATFAYNLSGEHFNPTLCGMIQGGGGGGVTPDFCEKFSGLLITKFHTYFREWNFELGLQKYFCSKIMKIFGA